ncbi:LacI family DNA-binding transcriptional regulator [Paenibacillus sp. H1-7]|uniref:LacI family DNA-binding transcriptional regulator n=1 Tax=Paenibacillus sp. H1-7 TaxID=2282849 RepID=UPI001EF92468|nr:LacI family DNA-binding transcriptional regulator [Paenibacillus sp. H1-7]ULL17209.1 LacI family DNA-binding transcriptional regulator [Paenibacillus sp. H1-7]
MITLKQISELANVSQATVSRVLNDDRTLIVTEETRRNIIAIAREHHYVKKERKSSKQNKKKTAPDKVAVLICHIEDEGNNLFFISIRHGIEKECKELGLVPVIYSINTLSQQEIDEQFLGIVVVGKVHPSIVENVNKGPDHIVYVGYSPDEQAYDSVIVDLEKAMESVLEHLLTHKYENIGFIGGYSKEYLNGNDTIETDDKRYISYKRRMQDLGRFRESDVYFGEYTMSEGYRLMKSAIASGHLPEAFVVACDPMAVGALKALQDEGISVPNQVALVSFDDTEMAQFASCPLSSVKIYSEEMGRAGVQLLMSRMKGREIPYKIMIPTELTIRNSCGTNKESH